MPKIRLGMLALYLVCCLLVGSVSALVKAHADNPENPPRWMTSPCQYEDSRNCFWDATVQGNGNGHSFYAIRVGNKTCLVFWNNKYARKHNRCVR